MKNNNTTELVFIIDRSGSMQGLEKDTIGGFNSMLEKQKREGGRCFVSTTGLICKKSARLPKKIILSGAAPPLWTPSANMPA